jgi:dolichyl-phosphate-mannose--protein O-mannosyl transferase
MLDRKDAAVILIISVAFFLVATFNVGAANIPSTSWQPKVEEVYITFPHNTSVVSLYFYINSEYNVSAIVSQKTVEGWKLAGYIDNTGYYKWVSSTDLNVVTDSLKIYFLAGEDIYEVVVVDENGTTIPIEKAWGSDPQDTNVSKLFDEQALFENPPTFISETYFDEIYFVRAAKEYLAQREVFEWTHPPLGKLIIATGISLFSFSPLGWRLISVVFAALMIPVVYVTGFVMFKTRFAACVSSLLLSLDFMHFTMGRIGTVDTFLVFFSTVSILFFYLNYDQISKSVGANPRYIFLGSVFASLAICVKWTAVLGVAGQIFLMVFATLIASPRAESIIVRLRSLVRPLLMTFLSFIFGGLIYVSTYIPYLTIGHTFGDLINLQIRMFGFHSGLPPEHSFASSWVTWPLMLRPFRFFIKYLPGDTISIINAMGNPAIWWFGLAAVLIALLMGIKERKANFIFLIVLYLSQLLPYALITRDTYIYHYYPEVPLLVLIIAGLLSEFWVEQRSRKYIVLYLMAVAIAFIAFYPAISGYSVPTWYIRWIKWFQAWDFLGV